MRKNRSHEKERFFLAFYRTARHALDVIALHAHKQRYDNAADNERACAKDGEIVVKTATFGVDHFIQSKGNGIQFPIADDRIDEDEIAPRRDERRKHRIHDDRFCKRQNDTPKDDRLACAV